MTINKRLKSVFNKKNIYKIFRIFLFLFIINIYCNSLLAQNAIDYKKFSQTIIKAEKYFKAKDYKNAKKEYKAALLINPEAQFPKNRLEQINKIYVDPEVEKTYNLLIKNADILFNSKKYQKASKEYQKALEIKPEKTYPNEKIKKINSILEAKKALMKKYNQTIKSADNFFKNNNYNLAKAEYENAVKIFPYKNYPKEKLKEISNYSIILSKYSKEINKADEYYISKDFENAKIYYQNAIKIIEKIKPEDKYAQNMLIKIEDLLKNQSKNKNSFEEIIANADILFKNKEYNSAKLGYQKALTIIPDEKYPKDKINEINKLISEKDKNYNSLILKGDNLFSNKNYLAARDKFQQATTLKPDKDYPKERISEINNLLKETETQKQNIYNNYVNQGDSCFSENKYKNAIAAFEKANNLFPNKEYPKNKISEINNLITYSKHKQTQYKNIISQADNFLKLNKLEKAKQEYQNANSIKSNEQYPKDKMAEINNIISEKESKNKKYKRILAEAEELYQNKNYTRSIQKYHEAKKLFPDAPYPFKKISEIKNAIIDENNTKLESLQLHLSKAIKYFNEEDYENSRDEYLNAYKFSDDDKNIIEKIKEISIIIGNKAIEKERAYKKAISEADNYYNSKIFDKAVEAYEKVLTITKGDVYSNNQIKKIKKLIVDNSVVNLCNSELIINKNKNKKFRFKTISPSLRKNNYIMIKIIPLSEKTKVFVSYGENSEKFGGIVFKTFEKDTLIDKIIRISTQDRWYRNDNNWLSIYPEGGDIKITFIQISKAD